jgi:hypothetical protein
MGTAVVACANESDVDGRAGFSTVDLRPTAQSNADRPAAGVVTVAQRTPRCTCGWTGKRRVALFLAGHDAWMHAAATGCVPGVPFVSK